MTETDKIIARHANYNWGPKAAGFVADYDIYSVPERVKKPNVICGQASLDFCKDAVRASLNERSSTG